MAAYKKRLLQVSARCGLAEKLSAIMVWLNLHPGILSTLSCLPDCLFLTSPCSCCFKGAIIRCGFLNWGLFNMNRIDSNSFSVHMEKKRSRRVAGIVIPIATVMRNRGKTYSFPSANTLCFATWRLKRNSFFPPKETLKPWVPGFV